MLTSPTSLQECLLTSWAHWQGASSTMLKRPTTTYAGKEREPLLSLSSIQLS